MASQNMDIHASTAKDLEITQLVQRQGGGQRIDSIAPTHKSIRLTDTKEKTRVNIRREVQSTATIRINKYTQHK